jgi:hypothetical protein
MNRGGLWWGFGLKSSPPAKSGTLPINIAAQNDSGGDVFNGFVTGDCISVSAGHDRQLWDESHDRHGQTCELRQAAFQQAIRLTRVC